MRGQARQSKRSRVSASSPAEWTQCIASNRISVRSEGHRSESSSHTSCLLRFLCSPVSPNPALRSLLERKPPTEIGSQSMSGGSPQQTFETVFDHRPAYTRDKARLSSSSFFFPLDWRLIFVQLLGLPTQIIRMSIDQFQVSRMNCFSDLCLEILPKYLLDECRTGGLGTSIPVHVCQYIR